MKKPLLVELRQRLQLWRGSNSGNPSQWLPTVISPREDERSGNPDSTLESEYMTGFDSQFLDDYGPGDSIEAARKPETNLQPRQPSPPPPAVADAAPAPTDAVVRDSSTLSTIGRYEVKGHLGAGGLGQVVEAWDPVLSRAVAVKTIQLNLEPSVRSTVEGLILNEAKAAAALNHPHIVTVFDAGLSPQGVYIAMERLDGRDMREALARGWRPRPSQSAVIMRRVAEALSYAHAKGVIHGDVKPANILLDRLDRPKLLDFSIASVLQQRWPGGEHLMMGGLHYLAPEQLLGGTIDARTDIRAMGVVLYELLTLNRAFNGNSVEEITEAVLRNQPVLAGQLRRNVPRTLSAIADKAMASDPAKRFNSALEMANALRQWSERHAARKERVASRNRTHRANEKVLKGLISPSQIALAAGLTLGCVALLWKFLPTAPEPVPAAEAKGQVKTNPEDEILFTQPKKDVAIAPDDDLTPEQAASAAAAAKKAAGPGVDAAGKPGADVAGDKAAGKPRGEATTAQTDTGIVTVAVSPWAQVEVNGVVAGMSPPMTQLSLPAGRQQITLRTEGFDPLTMIVYVRANEPIELRHRFTR